MYGSFYYEQNHMTPYWHCLDQVLVRKNLVNNVTNIEYLKKINSQQYKTYKGQVLHGDVKGCLTGLKRKKLI